LALVDVAVYDDPFVATRAIWDISKVREIFLARAAASNVGLSSIGGNLSCAQMDSHHGAYLRLADPGSTEGVGLAAPVGPGLVKPLRISAFRLLAVGDEEHVHFQPSILALDGEREVEIHRNREVTIRLSDRGPRVVDVGRTLALAAQRQCLYVSPYLAGGQCWLAEQGICRNPC
ncbi:MAG: hypothetical protein N2556_02470, partial [Anaerolineae bacterium]|nr:hypothetical protein [Anaerolineae bacterium]